MVRYVGWGGLPQAFDLEHPNWKDEAEELRQLLTVEEYAAARRSTQDAHYTSQEVIGGIYRGLERLGFGGPARILEPSAGVGHFFGLMPTGLREESKQVFAVELDPLSAAIGEYLYPEVQFVNKGFEDVNLPIGDFDLAIGNPPFGNQHLYDPHHPGLNFSVHNFFLSKSINSLREGGVAAFVVSRYFMDAVHNPAREYIAERANLLGAIRLPNTAFKRNALTEVTTDVVFIQRTNEPELEPAWLKTTEIIGQDGSEITINQYFADHPEQMIGQMSVTGGMFRDAADLLPPPDFAGFEAEIGQRLEILPQDIYRPRTDLVIDVQENQADPNLEICAGLKVDAYFVTGEGNLARRRADIMTKPSYEPFEPKNKRAGERITGMIKLRDSLTALMDLEVRDDASSHDLEEHRKKLNRLYDDFQHRHGYINSMANRQAMRGKSRIT
jgi:predicted RNA methylase